MVHFGRSPDFPDSVDGIRAVRKGKDVFNFTGYLPRKKAVPGSLATRDYFNKRVHG